MISSAYDNDDLLMMSMIFIEINEDIININMIQCNLLDAVFAILCLQTVTLLW